MGIMTTKPANRRKERRSLRMFSRPLGWKMERLDTGKPCPLCKHPGAQHFDAQDEIGYWGFCVHGSCNCFWDVRGDDETGSQAD